MTAKNVVILLTVASMVLALGGLTFTALGFANARREAAKDETMDDVRHVRKVIGEFVYGSKLWQAYLGVGLTALSVVAGGVAGLVSALSAP